MILITHAVGGARSKKRVILAIRVPARRGLAAAQSPRCDDIEVELRAQRRSYSTGSQAAAILRSMSPLKNAGGGSSLQSGGGCTDRELSEFLLLACHDLRTPLRAMRAHAELLLTDARSPAGNDSPQRLAFIAAGAKQADLLLDGLVSYAIALQVDAASFRSVPTDVILRTVLAKMVNELRENDADVSYGELPYVTGHPDRLMQVFENLLRNALRHRGAASPRIQVTAEPYRRQSDGAAAWRFAVRDNGPGLSADDLESIFRPFAKAGSERSGAGLGLATCRLIVEKHGGRIWAESEEGNGSMFLITLPAEDGP
jgi:signal transduction histidine kinase